MYFGTWNAIEYGMKNYKLPEYSGFETSPAILNAIELIAGDSILDSDSAALRIWTNPTDIERDLVEATAWSTTVETELNWGVDKIVK